MARLSIGSQYFQAKERRESMVYGQNASKPETDKGDPDFPNPSFNTNSGDLPSTVDNYIAQNKLLAMKNSEMALRMSEMEAKMSELIRQNALLKNGANGHRNSEKLEQRLRQIETSILKRLGHVLATLLEIRAEESLPENPMVSVVEAALPGRSKPVTSTPTTDNLASFLGEKAEYWGDNEGETTERSRANSVLPDVDMAMIEGQSREEATELQNERNILPESSQGFSVHMDTLEHNNLATVEELVLSPEKGQTKRIKLHPETEKQLLDRSSRRKPVNYRLSQTKNDDFKDDTESENNKTSRHTINKSKATRKPLSNVTNRRRAALRRKAKDIVTREEEVPDKEIFEFVEPEELETQTRLALLRTKRRGVI